MFVAQSYSTSFRNVNKKYFTIRPVRRCSFPLNCGSGRHLQAGLFNLLAMKKNSKEETKLYEAISGFYDGEIIQNYRPDFLKNKRTGNNLEIDIFLPQHGVGFEYQGAVHFRDIDRYKNDSDKSRLHDTLKYEYIDSFETSKRVIVEVFEMDLIGDIKKNIAQRILNTQKRYFYKKQFKKCATLEVLYGAATGMRDTPISRRTIKWFETCNNILITKRTKYEFIRTLFEIIDSGDFLHKEIRFRRLSINVVCRLTGLLKAKGRYMDYIKKNRARRLLKIETEKLNTDILATGTNG